MEKIEEGKIWNRKNALSAAEEYAYMKNMKTAINFNTTGIGFIVMI